MDHALTHLHVTTETNPILEMPNSLGAAAYQAITKHLKKTVKYKSKVLKDTDPEALHQMRVGTRRLRTAFELFGRVIQVPDKAGDRQLSKLAQRLGEVRDLDVLLGWFQTYAETAQLSAAELKTLETVQAELQDKRQHRFERMESWLKGDHYKTLVQAWQAWLVEPDFQAAADMPLQMVLPDLLLPSIGRVFQHPGWLVGTHTNARGQLTPIKRMSLKRINDCLAESAPCLHDLRKRMKHVRYQTELFLDQYDLAYAARVKEFKTLQDVLGTLQDEAVMGEFLTEIVGEQWQTELPALTKQFETERRQIWQQWQALQTQYLKLEFRQQLRQQMITIEPHPMKYAGKM